jgi:polyisoprenoid-binding protein YceI
MGDSGHLCGCWILDQEETTVAFRSRAMWIVPVKGSAKAIRGNAEVDADGSVTGTFVIDAASFKTNHPTRDDHLR